MLRQPHVDNIRAEEMDGDTDRDEERGRRMMPYWNLWSSDFFGWVEELRAQAAYDRIEDLARTFWAHFPIANELKLDVPDSDPPPEE
ncbi:otospiralin-like [Lampris incognitus]|uniref:otospiralin-like n=1 Tax=Lampris incognitus TaxID=2546036 RepID=UPI0024B51022|nr:otospiralin-like [Lampris incognitus]